MISGVSALRLPDLVGPGKATEYLFLGQKIPLEEAVSVGLVNRIADDAGAIAEEWAQAIAKAPAAAVAASKNLATFRRRLTLGERAEIGAMRLAVEAKNDFKGQSRQFYGALSASFGRREIKPAIWANSTMPGG